MDAHNKIRSMNVREQPGKELYSRREPQQVVPYADKSIWPELTSREYSPKYTSTDPIPTNSKSSVATETSALQLPSSKSSAATDTSQITRTVNSTELKPITKTTTKKVARWRTLQ